MTHGSSRSAGHRAREVEALTRADDVVDRL
jgi:hypothetical protein